MVVCFECAHSLNNLYLQFIYLFYFPFFVRFCTDSLLVCLFPLLVFPFSFPLVRAILFFFSFRFPFEGEYERSQKSAPVNGNKILFHLLFKCTSEENQKPLTARTTTKKTKWKREIERKTDENFLSLFLLLSFLSLYSRVVRKCNVVRIFQFQYYVISYIFILIVLLAFSNTNKHLICVNCFVFVI